jgi:hypothetical protein
MANDLRALNRRLDKLTTELVGGKQLERSAFEVGMMAKGAVAELSGAAALGGDLAFSGWRRKGGKDMPLAVQFDVKGTPGSVKITRARMSAGPWRVAEEGRHPGMPGPMQGPRLTKKGKVSRARVKRWNGSTDPKGSWTAYETIVAPKVMPVVAKSYRAALGRAVIG